MLLQSHNTEGIGKLGSDTHSLELHYPTAKGVMKLTSQPKVDSSVVLIFGTAVSTSNKCDALYVVEPEFSLMAIEKLRKIFSCKHPDVISCKVLRLDELPHGRYSIILEHEADGKMTHYHYFANNHYASDAVGWYEVVVGQTELPTEGVLNTGVITDHSTIDYDALGA